MKLRSRRNPKPEVAPETREYTFLTPKKRVSFDAPSLNEARKQFQERFGYWPEREEINE